MSKKERILNNCRANGGTTIPIDSFVNYIRENVVTYRELCEAGLKDDLAEKISQRLELEDDQLWIKSVQINTIQSYSDYLLYTSLGKHKDEAQSKIDEFDDRKWTDVQSSLSANSLNYYLDEFPKGKHAVEAQGLLADLPWLDTKRKNTIEAYTLYMQNNPGKHVTEAHAAIRSIQDDRDWNNACVVGTSQAYRDYLTSYPHGKHAIEAQNRIDSGAAGEQFLNALRIDPNAYPAVDPDPSNRDTIQASVGNGVITWNDIANIFGYEKMEAIRSVSAPTPLPSSVAPDSLQPNSTEVYFWGTPGSGKTCALGTIISSANRTGILETLSCTGQYYMDLLSNIFIGNSYCTLPDSTQTSNIQEMIMKLTDEKGRQHKLTLIDLAGELFRMVFKTRNNMFVTDEDKIVLDKAMNYLEDNRNNKIHFFIVEYGAHAKMWDGLNMANYLSQMIQFLKEKKVFRKSTVGVYVLVTKCDRMSCDRSERPRVANEYVKTKLASFWNTLERTCKDAAISDLRTLSFSVGDVFAQNLCVYDGEDTKKVINKLLTKTPAIKRFSGWLNS